jgi:hypothetical protein
MSGTLSPVGKQYFTDGNGLPLSGGFVYTYAAGTATPATTYSDLALATPNANPIVLDSAGRCVIYLASGSYKYVVYDAADGLQWSQDAVTATSSTAVLGQSFFFGGDSASPITQTSYTVGTGYASLLAGTSILSVDSDSLAGTYALQGMLMAPTGQTVTVAIVNLSDGSPQTPLATISGTDDTGSLVTSGAITFAAGGASKSYGVKGLVAASGTAFAWAISLVRTA